MLVTKKAPDFTTGAVLADNSIVENFNLYENFGSNGAVLFFYPLDFTFVCPSEIIAFGKRVDKFKEKSINIIGVSVDSVHTHYAWKNTPVNKGGIEGVNMPLVSDLNKKISKNYDVLLKDGISLRGSFLIDKDGTVRHSVVNDLPLGRNVDEMLRMVDTMIHTNENGEVCPAGWNKGDAAMKDTHDGVADYLAQNADKL